MLFAAGDIDQIFAIGAMVVAVVVLFMVLIVFAVFANYLRLWLQSFFSRAGITIWDLIGMTFRKVNKDVIVKSKIMAVQAGLDEDQGITSKALEARDLQEKMAANGAEVAYLGGEEFAKLVRLELSNWARIVKSSGARID